MKRELKLLLSDVIRARRPDLLHVLGRDPIELENGIKDEIRETVGEELAATGFDAKSEPTARGLLLEELIDLLSPF
jgi:hypothetical protein